MLTIQKITHLKKYYFLNKLKKNSKVLWWYGNSVYVQVISSWPSHNPKECVVLKPEHITWSTINISRLFQSLSNRYWQLQKSSGANNNERRKKGVGGGRSMLKIICYTLTLFLASNFYVFNCSNTQNVLIRMRCYILQSQRKSWLLSWRALFTAPILRKYNHVKKVW